MSQPLAARDQGAEHADVHVDRLTYSYADTHSAALSEISLRITQGEYIALLGHNGSGKSTLSRLMGGLNAPDSGVVTVAGLDVTAEDARARVR
ncbi:MAG TPA: ATP-binding cassette domain-containing protein, partial [Ktedonobacterales bacterium]